MFGPRIKFNFYKYILSQYLPDIEDAIFRMTDSDKNGAIRYAEIRSFLASPDVPNFIRNDLRLTPEAIKAADKNRNGQLERHGKLFKRYFPCNCINCT